MFENKNFIMKIILTKILVYHKVPHVHLVIFIFYLTLDYVCLPISAHKFSQALVFFFFSSFS